MITACILMTSCSKDEEPIFGGIYGTIRDAETGMPIYNAEIILSPGSRTTVSGRDGSYEYQNVDAGQYTLSVAATGYQYNNRTVTVLTGESTLCDMRLVPEAQMSGIEISTTSLNFDRTYSELTFDIRNTGTSGSISWTITGIDAAWLSVSPMSGTTEMGKSSSIKVTVNRSLITEDTSSVFTVNAAGGSKSIMVSVRAGNGSGNNNENDNENVDGTTEDYSSAVVASCDNRIDVRIVDCKRNGSSVTFNYTLTNKAWETLNEFRICSPSGGATPMGQKTYIYDDQGNDYIYPTIYIGDKYTTNNVLVYNSLPKDLPRKCSVTIRDVPSTVKNLTLRIACYAYPTSVYNFASECIKIDNLPIY